MSGQLGQSMSFSQALMALEDGFRVTRPGWNGKGMWLFLQTGKLVHPADVTHPILSAYATNKDSLRKPGLCIRPWIGMFTADEEMVPWVASQSDLLAKDWMIVK